MPPRDPILSDILLELRSLRGDVADMREEVAGYRGALNVFKWVFGLVTVPTLSALVWVLKKVGIIVTS